VTAALVSLWSVGVFSGVAMWLARQTETPAASLVERYCTACFFVSVAGIMVLLAFRIAHEWGRL